MILNEILFLITTICLYFYCTYLQRFARETNDSKIYINLLGVVRIVSVIAVVGVAVLMILGATI